MLRLPWSSGVGDGSPAGERHPCVGHGREPHPPPVVVDREEQLRTRTQSRAGGGGQEGGAGLTVGSRGGGSPSPREAGTAVNTLRDINQDACDTAEWADSHFTLKTDFSRFYPRTPC